MDNNQAKYALDKLIRKARVHFYKPIQIAEILYHHRMGFDIDLAKLESYRNPSKRWRDDICIRFLGRISTSSARYQDDLFNENAMPPAALVQLGLINRNTAGAVEAYIYKQFAQRLSQVSIGLEYCQNNTLETFNLKEFLGLFWHEPGLRRSIDKIYEIVVYALFSAIIDALAVRITVNLDISKIDIYHEFEDFAGKVLQLSPQHPEMHFNAQIYRMGVTNAADRGLDMWANFGLAIQVKHLSLTEELAEEIVSPITSDRIIIVCKDAEERLILSLLNQLGWKAKVQSIVTESNLLIWYEKALRGRFRDKLGKHLIDFIMHEMETEFPASNKTEFAKFMAIRGYTELKPPPGWEKEEAVP